MNSRAIVSAGMVILAVACPAAAQVQLGGFNLNGSGTLSAGYTGNYGNLTQSDHGITFGAAGTLNGFFYSPNFLSFNVQPFLNQSRENSNYQSISDTSGVNASTSIFGGSHFPGTISYSRTFNSQGNFAVPGVTDFVSHGDSQVLNVSWSELVPKLPTFTISFLDGSDRYSIYGADGDLSSTYRSLLLQSNYTIAGFHLNGSFRDSVSHSAIPEVLGNPAESSDSSAESYSFGLSHKLPFHGSFSASASRSDLDADYSIGNYHAVIDSVSGGMSFAPIPLLNVGINYQYTDNLAGTLDQAIVAAGGAVEGSPQGSHSMSITSFANYTVLPLHLVFSGTDEYRDQVFDGQGYRGNSQTGSVTYNNSILGGSFTATAGIMHSTVSSSDHGLFGVNGSVNYAHDVKRWTTSVMLHYSENAETVLVAYTNTGYGYSGALGRQFGRKSHWSASAAGSRNQLSNQTGASSFSQSYSTVLSIRWVGVSGSYSKSTGQSILTSSGLTPVTAPLTVIAPSSVILHGGRAYSGGIGLTPLRGFVLSASYAEAFSNTQGDSVASENRTRQLNTYLQYQMRKIYLTAGYSRLTQSFSSNGNLPAMVGSFYFGLSRWFNFL